MMHQESHELLHLLIDRQAPMVVPPDVLRQVERQALLANPTFGRQPALQVAPEPLQAVDVGAARASVLPLAVLDQTMHVALGGNPRVAGQGVRADGRAAADPSSDQRQERPGGHVGHDLRPHLAVATEDAEDRRLGRAAATLGAQCTDHPAFVAPRATHVGLVHLDRAPEDRWDLAGHRSAQDRQRSQDAGLGHRQLAADRLGAQAADVPSQQRAPLRARQPQRQARAPVVSAAGASIASSSEHPSSGVVAAGTPLPFGHGVILASQVSGIGLYPLESPARGSIRITARGAEILKSNLSRVDVQFLKQFPEFVEFQSASRRAEADQASEVSQTPEEILELSYQSLRRALGQELLERVKQCSPRFFERLVVDLLVAMGYGGSRRDAGQAVGRSGDDGIDGIIKEDRLGLDTVCVQAKRWDTPVGRSVVQAFAGSLEGHRARKGVLIATSRFTPDAVEYVNRIEKKVVLIDGEQLAQLMIDHGIGVANVAKYEVKKIDVDYFEAE